MDRYRDDLYGSLTYMAPELLVMNELLLYPKPNFASDIWALAATLTEMFTGRRLYGLEHPDRPTLWALKALLDLPESIVNASKELNAVFASSLNSDPERRPQSCRILLQLINQHLAVEHSSDSGSNTDELQIDLRSGDF